MKHSFLIGILISLAFSCTPNLPEDVKQEYVNLPDVLDFNIHVKPILSDKCFLCHGPDKAKQKAGLRLDLPGMALGELPQHPGKKAIVPGDLSKSEVYRRILSYDPEVIMPAPESNLTLSPYEKAVLVKWIEDGAEYKQHWAFVRPEKVTPPKVKDIAWVENPIDQFILRKLEDKKLSHSPMADKSTLLRRVALDLTGLPPKPDEIKDFLNDSSENAYEKQVDRLLASPQFGEKMATDWVDLARYADTHGYTVDEYRDMSPWRDWVIHSFNQNMPYDQFVTWQLAGDLLPDPSREQILATAFNRLHPQNREGGIIEEEFRVEYVIDRANTFGQAFMALTVGCARCHDHKYDPISQQEFYELTSFFNNVNEAGQISFDGAMPVPTILLTTKVQDEVLAYLQHQIQGKEDELEQIAREEETPFQQWLNAKKYQYLSLPPIPNGGVGHFTFDNKHLNNSLPPKQTGTMMQQGSDHMDPLFSEGFSGFGLKLDGDTWFDTNIGSFGRSEPFTVGIHVKIPRIIKDGVLFHKGIGAALYDFKGFHLALKENQLELLMAHTVPDNAIIEYGPDLPRDVWIQLTMTYDGSSTADGLKVYLNGAEIQTKVEIDNLYKGILFEKRNLLKKEPGIQVGARWRGVGIGGAMVDNLMIFDRELSPIDVLMIADRKVLKGLMSKERANLDGVETSMFRKYYLTNLSDTYQKAIRKLGEARSAYVDSVENVQELMVMKEMEKPRQAYILDRGIYNAHGKPVSSNTPGSIMEMSNDAPKNRLGLAQWLFNEDHPLTSRVAVNRYWQNYFGLGIVRTTEDFGNQGELPSHPGLLDWLAQTFISSGWDVKYLQKLIVMSATYQQSSDVSKSMREIDPENRLLARGPMRRLSGEMIRDNALAASGLLNSTIGGESVSPYQPDGLWKVNNANYKVDKGDKLYRRSLYTIWKRTVPHPTLSTFDTPSRSECTVRRQRTNTPLQALVLLNDPIFIECSRVIGERITSVKNEREGIIDAFVRLTGRVPRKDELEILIEMQQQELKKFEESPSKAKGWLTTGDSRPSPVLDPIQVAANAVVASTIMNTDASLTKR